MARKPFTVIAYSEESGQSVCDHVMANNGMHAFWVAAQTRHTFTMVVALPGHLTEGAGNVVFPGEGVVDAGTILEQSEVFGSDNDGCRYVTGVWNHIFADSNTPRDLRFVYDTQTEKVIAMQILTGTEYANATCTQMADVQDSLMTANEEFLENPADYGLESTNDLPDWTDEISATS